MALMPKQIDDLVALTDQKFVKKWAYLDLQTDITDFVAVRELLGKHKTTFQGGLDWEFEASVDHNHSARFTGLYDNDGGSVADTFIKGKVGPRFIDANYIYDLREPVFQRGGLAIVDYLKAKYLSMRLSYLSLLEETLWGKPADASDEKTPYGLAFWITKQSNADAATHPDGAFDGKDPAGFPQGRAGISTAKQPRWANWAAQYDSVSKEDLVQKMRRATRKIAFRSPISHAQPDIGKMGNGIYVSDGVIGVLEQILEQQNMNLGNDIAPKDGRVLFKGTPVTYAPKLDADASEPIYMVDWKWLVLGMMGGWAERVSAPREVPGKHNVRQVFLDSGVNMVCTDLRRQAVIHKAL